jgi:hypothetical protein
VPKTAVSSRQQKPKVTTTTKKPSGGRTTTPNFTTPPPPTTPVSFSPKLLFVDEFGDVWLLLWCFVVELLIYIIDERNC